MQQPKDVRASSPNWLQRRAGLALMLGGLLGAWVVCTSQPSRALDAKAVQGSRPDELTNLGYKFDGAASSSAVKCHGLNKPKAPPAQAGNEHTLWSRKDPHNRAYETLTKDKSKQIAQKMNLGDASTAQRCLTCHSISVPPNLQGQKFSVQEGVSCTACHGPSEKYLEPHATEGWTKKQRDSMDHASLLTKWGLYDTKPLVARAEKCTSCHLAIDADMVAAGHPQPQFELAYFSNPGVYEDRHWPEDLSKYADVKVWASGQTVETRAAMLQLAARASGKASDDLLKGAYEQAAGHLAMLRQLGFAGLTGIDADLETLATKLKTAMAAGNRADLAAGAQGIATIAAKGADGTSTFAPDKAKTLKMLNGIAGDTSVAKEGGLTSMKQQAYAIYVLYTAYANAESDPAKDQVTGLIGDKLFPEHDPDANAFAQNLSDVKAKLPAP